MTENFSSSQGSDFRAHFVALLIFVVACAIIAAVGEGGVALFVAGLIGGIAPALILYLVWLSLAERSGARFVLLLVCGAGFMFVVSGHQKAAKRKAMERIQSMKAAQEYEAWYNRLSPYERLQVDNARLEEENARLRQRDR